MLFESNKLYCIILYCIIILLNKHLKVNKTEDTFTCSHQMVSADAFPLNVIKCRYAVI